MAGLDEHGLDPASAGGPRAEECGLDRDSASGGTTEEEGKAGEQQPASGAAAAGLFSCLASAASSPPRVVGPLLRPHSRPSPSLGPHGNGRVFRSGFRRGKGEIERLDGAMTDTRRRLASVSATHGAAGSAGSGRGRLGRQRARRSRPGARIGGDAHTRSDGDRFCCQHRGHTASTFQVEWSTQFCPES
ncbi:uncharacterized protein LOC119268068 [Triticum dicoccoides]|uniref:uncharacterized protein LOC119268068 n=1 Tax=Triticum dicoccoides TaxID=85692 RepID=UPI00188F51C2|nr:uncharacterized protein LOC119268068 [Triticum dicoccoides]XP_044340060.1 uncharacterized protein LOC123061177 [Triticum aestivum]